MSAPGPELVIVGRVRRAHGIRGELAVEATTDEPDAVFASGRRVFVGTAAGDPLANLPPATIQRSSPFKGGFIVALEGVATRNDAELWRNRTFLLPVDELAPPDEGEVYRRDLVGMRAVLSSGEEVGTIDAYYELPQGLVIEIARPGKPSVLVPFHESAVTDVDGENRVVTLDPPAGMLD